MRKAILWAVIAVIVVGGGIWWWAATRNPASSPSLISSNQAANPVPTSSLPQGDSNQSISQEMTSIDAQMNGLSSDTANISSSMNDQPVQQAQ